MNILEVYLDKLELDSEDAYEIAPSKIHGNGVMANKHFKPGDYINICVSKIQDNDPKLIITPFGSYINHSYKPTAVIKKEPPYYNTYAKVELNPGDEVTVDYSKHKEFKQPDPSWD